MPHEIPATAISIKPLIEGVVILGKMRYTNLIKARITQSQSLIDNQLTKKRSNKNKAT